MTTENENMDHNGPAEDSVASDPLGLTVEQVKDPRFKWYVVQAYSGFEEKAKTQLLERARSSGLGDKFGSIIVPTKTSEKVLKSGKKKTITRVQYPGYIYVQMLLSDDTIHMIKQTPRISGFLGDQRHPRPLPDYEVLRVTSPELVQESVKKSEPLVAFSKGEAVKVTDGPFSNFDGVVDEVMGEKMRLRVLVSIFGRETPVDLEYSQVQKLT